VRIVELAGIGPGPFCGMLLADFGAEVVLVNRKGGLLSFEVQRKYDITRRDKHSIAVNLKKPGAAEHDLNFVALSGLLHHRGHRDSAPTIPPTVVGDIGGGAMYMALGLVSGIPSARTTWRGQVIDAAITDGCAVKCTLVQGLRAQRLWADRRRHRASARRRPRCARRPRASASTVQSCCVPRATGTMQSLGLRAPASCSGSARTAATASTISRTARTT
jgi:crotonobetainyl-CoA:carnitine CoA-transferase CaiB-like acyl-CoA transferase